MSTLRIGQLARASGVTEKTIRYYDQIGLLTPSGRSAARYRLYGHDAIERLRFVRNARDLGFTLRDIRDILELSDGGRVPCAHVLAVVERDLRAIDARLTRLGELRSALLGVKAKLVEAVTAESCEPGRACPCVA